MTAHTRACMAQNAQDAECVCEVGAEGRADEAAAARLLGALLKINEIRNSIVGSQTINWSEHIYPLVTALDKAGIEGLSYPKARANVGTLLERNAALTVEVARLNGKLALAKDETERALRVVFELLEKARSGK